MKTNRVKNSFYNICASLMEYFLKVILVFIVRTIFIKKLGSEFLGLDGLYTNILAIMNITELGLGSAIIFSLYKPLLKNDKEKINIIMHIYRKCYFYIGCFILFAGLCLMPFLPKIINSSYDFGNIYFIFFLYILQTLSTYWVLAYKSAILTADQKKYKLIIISSIFYIVEFIFQFVALYFCNSFELYIASSIVANILKNVVIAIIADRNYPYAKKYNNMKLEKKEQKSLIQNVFGMSLYKISSTVMNSTDNIIISVFISLTVTGIYANYLLIVSNVKRIISSIFGSFTASVGNLFAEGDKIKSEFIFRCINFLNFWIYGLVAICLWELLNPFVTLWLGEQYVFSKMIVLLIVLNFITDGLQHAVIVYKDACGLFWKGKLRPVFSAISNIVISIILVKIFGIIGVILGSIISRMITTWWFDPYLVYKNAFEMPVRSYYLRYLRSLFLIIGVAFFIDLIVVFISVDLLKLFIIKLILCIIIPNLIFYLLFKKTEEFKYMKDIIVKKFKKIK